MKKYINTSNYYLSTITSEIKQGDWTAWSFDVADVTVDWVTLPLEWYYWVDVDFGDVSKREIFRIVKREWYTLTYDARISPYWMKTHDIGTTVALRDFSQLLNSLSTNTDNFWEVEELWGLNILVRWGNVFSSGDASWVSLINKKTLSLPASSTVYIVLNYTSPELLSVAEFDIVEEITDTWMYPIAKIITTSTGIESVEDLRSTMIYWWGEGDMKWAEWKSIYDINNKELDVYDMDNMVQWTNNLYISPVDKIKYDDYQTNKQDTLVSWENIHTINWQSILGPGNFPLDTILTVGWDVCQTEDWAATFTFTEHVPLTDDAFIVFSDSGTMLIRGWENPNDYTYDNTTHTITFNNPLYEDEHAIVWVMYNNSTEQSQIGSADITLKYWENEATFSANQMDDITIDFETDLGLWDIANDSTITITQWGNTTQSFTTNQNEDQTITLQWNIPVTQDEYNNLPESKTTDGNWYWIVEEAE